MMRDYLGYFFVLLCSSISEGSDSVRYYYDYECNEPLVATAKLSATSSLRERGADNAKLYVLSKQNTWEKSGKHIIWKTKTSSNRRLIGLQVHNHLKTRTKLWTLTFSLGKKIITMAQHNARWAFNTKNWTPTGDQILAASSYIQTEEKERISQFVFQDDAKSSLIGRLMIRKYVHLSTSIPYEEICLGRDSHGKPGLVGTANVVANFNVSHQGDYVVLAGSAQNNVGIDIMKIEPPRNKNISEFFRIMSRQFSPREWETIRSYPTELEQVASFYRHWCLKESYVKNTGFGITVNLAELSFSVKTRKLQVGEMVKDTTLFYQNVLKHDWVFEETLLDEKHAVAVALRLENKSDWNPIPCYTFLTFDDLVTEAKPLVKPDQVFKNSFMKKDIKIL